MLVSEDVILLFWLVLVLLPFGASSYSCKCVYGAIEMPPVMHIKSDDRGLDADKQHKSHNKVAKLVGGCPEGLTITIRTAPPNHANDLGIHQLLAMF